MGFCQDRTHLFSAMQHPIPKFNQIKKYNIHIIVITNCRRQDMIQLESPVCRSGRSDSGYVKGYSNEFHPRVAVALAEAQGTKCSVLYEFREGFDFKANSIFRGIR